MLEAELYIWPLRAVFTSRRETVLSEPVEVVLSSLLFLRGESKLLKKSFHSGCSVSGYELFDLQNILWHKYVILKVAWLCLLEWQGTPHSLYSKRTKGILTRTSIHKWVGRGTPAWSRAPVPRSCLRWKLFAASKPHCWADTWTHTKGHKTWPQAVAFAPQPKNFQRSGFVRLTCWYWKAKPWFSFS